MKKISFRSKKPPVEAYISNRETQILELIASGFSSSEIAKKLFISDHTVISHRKKLIQKFRAKNSAHLITKAFQRGFFNIDL